MVDLLTQYFAQHKEIMLPGLGFLKAREESARYDASQQKMLPPYLAFIWQPGDNEIVSLQPLLGHISRQTQQPEEEAFAMLNKITRDIKQTIEFSGEWPWPNLGKLVQLAGGNIGFVPEPVSAPYYPGLYAPRVVRKERTHQMLVGDKETDTLQMQQELGVEEEETTGGKWWVPSLIMAIVTICIIIARLASWW